VSRTDQDADVSRLNHRLVLILATWLGTLAVTLAFAWGWGGRTISRRAAAVSAVAQQIGEGKPGSRTAFKTSADELDHIAAAIDQMAESVERREQALSAGNRRLSQANDELRRANLLLERKVETGAEELARAQASLRVANRDLEAFSSALSHDLRAPLRAIAGFGERLQLESADHLDEPGRHCLDRIRAGAATMHDLIDDLLSLSQITRADMTMERVDLSKLAREVFEELRKQQPDRPVEIVIRENMSAIGDVRLLRVVLVHLLGNALKYSAARELSVIEVGEHELAGDTAMFFVRDNGAGFDPAYAGKMFGIFQRLHSAKEFPGRGIGLATVQRIIQRHGGRVSVEGAVDQGAKACFWLRRE
jgi:light-regulated signal transduction histidine kinase (bacteriophytochrome)/HAMP domain-containing protein